MLTESGWKGCKGRFCPQPIAHNFLSIPLYAYTKYVSPRVKSTPPHPSALAQTFIKRPVTPEKGSNTSKTTSPEPEIYRLPLYTYSSAWLTSIALPMKTASDLLNASQTGVLTHWHASDSRLIPQTTITRSVHWKTRLLTFIGVDLQNRERGSIWNIATHRLEISDKYRPNAVSGN